MSAPRQDHLRVSTAKASDPRDVKVLGQREATLSVKAITPAMIDLLREQFLPHEPIGDTRVVRTLDGMISEGVSKAQRIGRAEVINYLESLITPVKDDSE